MSRFARSLGLLWADLCTMQAYQLLTAIVAFFTTLCIRLSACYRSETCDGVLHQLRGLFEPGLSLWLSYLW